MAGSGRKRAFPSGFEEEFVNQVDDDYQCAICKLPAKEPIQTRPCGHRFCKECMEENMRRQEDNDQPLTCPVDRQILDREKDIFVDKATKRKIHSFAIKCPSEGCDWTGELRNKEVHLTSCPFKQTSCTNKGCGENVRRKDLRQHLIFMCQWRIINCNYCRETYPLCQMKGHIGLKCKKLPVACPNKCYESFAREKVSNHIVNDCPLTIISCSYEEMGCETKVERRQLDSHLESAVRRHLDLACVKLKNTEVKLNDTEVKLNDTQLKLYSTEVKLQETTRSLMQKLETLERRFEEKRMEDQENAAKEKIVMVKNADFQGVFVWKIDDFSKIFRQAKTGEKEITECTPFYTENHGYRLKVIMYPNGVGSGKNTHLSVFIVVMKGEYDAILPWPFKKKVKFTLIDQHEDPAERENVIMQFKPGNDPKSFARPAQEENTGRGYHEFISHEKLHSRRYLVDETLFLQVKIRP